MNRRMHNKLMVSDNAAAIVGGRNIGDVYYGVNAVANFRDLDVLAVGPVIGDLSAVFNRFWNSASTVPIAAIVDRAQVLPISTPSALDCGRRSPRPTTLIRSSRTWMNWRLRRPRCATILSGRTVGSSLTTRKHRAWTGKRQRDRVHPRRIARLKEELLVEVALFRPPRRGAGNGQGATRAPCPGARADQLARLQRHAPGPFRLCQDP